MPRAFFNREAPEHTLKVLAVVPFSDHHRPNAGVVADRKCQESKKVNERVPKYTALQAF